MSVEAVHVRLEEHHRRLAELESTRPAVIANDVESLRRDINELTEEVRGLRRAWWSVSLTLAASMIGIAFTAYQLAGG